MVVYVHQDDILVEAYDRQLTTEPCTVNKVQLCVQ